MKGMRSSMNFFKHVLDTHFTFLWCLLRDNGNLYLMYALDYVAGDTLPFLDIFELLLITLILILSILFSLKEE